MINRTKLPSGEADVIYYSDYYPFGEVLRSGGIGSRYGYQGSFAEKDGETGWNKFELRQYEALQVLSSSLEEIQVEQCKEINDYEALGEVKSLKKIILSGSGY